MTATELVKQLNTTYGLTKPWPKTLEVSPETYGYCCQAVFDQLAKDITGDTDVKLGINNGLMFKNMELIISNRVDD